MGIFSHRGPVVPSTDVAGALGLLAAGALLVDVRERREFAQGHAPGAVNLPLSRLRRTQDTLPEGRDVVVMCRSGHRSAVAARALAGPGRDLTNLGGGLAAWAQADQPIIPGSD